MSSSVVFKNFCCETKALSRNNAKTSVMIIEVKNVNKANLKITEARECFFFYGRYILFLLQIFIKMPLLFLGDSNLKCL